jgi:hypothetical protein
MKFDEWLNAPVRNGTSLVKRATWIRKFVGSGLYPWLKSKGYAWAVSERTLANCIATGLYENMGLSCIASVWDYPTPNSDFHQDDKMHFYHVVSLDEWDKFWLVWREMDDVSDDSPRGQDRRFDIQDFVWGQLDLENSRQTQILDEILEEPMEEEEWRSNRVDIYIQEHYEKY